MVKRANSFTIKDLKVLIISQYHNAISNRSEADIVIGLKKNGVKITVLTISNSPLKPLFYKHGIRVLEGHPQSKIDIKALWLLRQLIKEEDFDLIHAFNSKAISVSCLASFGLPVSVVAYIGARDPSVFDPTAFLGIYNPGIDAIICVSDYVKSDLVARKIVSKEKLFTVPKGIDLNLYENISPVSLVSFDIPDSAFVVMGVANVRPVKGIDYLIKAFAQLHQYNDMYLVLVGKDTDSEKIHHLILQCQNKGCILTLGYQPNVLPLMKRANVYIQPSISEGLSKSVMEAMSLRTPVISTRCGGPEDLIEDQVSGLLVETANVDAIALAIQKLYNQRELCQQFGDSAYKFLSESYTITSSVEQTIEVYNAVLNRYLRR